MKRWSSLLSAAVFAAGFAAADAYALTSSTLYAIGSDANGVGRTLSAVDPVGAGTDLGDGSLAFNGLAFLASTGRAYTIGNDSFGNSFLTSFLPSTPSALAPTLSLGSGFYGGLAASGSSLYAIGSSSSGASSLYSVNTSTGANALGSLGNGFYGGLTWNSGSLYAIGGDDFGVQRRFSRIDLAGGTPTVTTLFDLGDGSLGFQGGLAYDASAGRFVTIANDSLGASALYGFSLAGATSLTDLGKPLGSGFVNGGLAYLAAPVPEAPFALLFALGLPVLLVARKQRAAR